MVDARSLADGPTIHFEVEVNQAKQTTTQFNRLCALVKWRDLYHSGSSDQTDGGSRLSCVAAQRNHQCDFVDAINASLNILERLLVGRVLLFHKSSSKSMTTSYVTNVAMAAGTARTIAGAKPENKNSKKNATVAISSPLSPGYKPFNPFLAYVLLMACPTDVY